MLVSAATTLNTATETVNSFAALVTSVITAIPAIGYALTMLASVLKPPEQTEGLYYLFHKAVNIAAFNVGRAKNATTEEIANRKVDQ